MRNRYKGVAFKRRREKNCFGFNSFGDIFDEDRINSMYIRNIIESGVLFSTKELYSYFMDCVETSLKKTDFKLWQEAQNIVNKKFKLEAESGDIEEFSSDFDYEDFIKLNAKKLNLNADKLAALVFSKLTSRVSKILEKTFKLKDFNEANPQAIEVQEFLGISDIELKVMVFFVAITYFPTLKRFFEALSSKTQELFISLAISISRQEYIEVISSENKLLKRGVLRKGYRGSKDLLEVNGAFLEFIIGNSKSFVHNLCHLIKPEEIFDIDSFDVKQSSKKIILNLLKSPKPCKILLYGKAGTGKTQFAKSIINELNKDIVLPKKKNAEEDSDLGQIGMCEHIAHKINSIALIDECDNILATKSSLFSFGTNSSDKGELNICLDGMQGKSIWITNCIERIDESTKRRFSHSLEFDGLSKTQKLIALETALNKSNLKGKIAPEKIYELSEKYKLSTAGIALVVENTSDVIEGETQVEILEIMEEIALSQRTLIRGIVSTKEQRYKPDSHFDSKIINMDMDYNRLISSMRTYNKKLEEKQVNCPMNLIFAGVTGSGKTELAKHIANTLEKNIVIKNMSDLKSKYIGETEKDIANAFRQAECENAILVIDEADSLFIDRSSAKRSWEVSQTNEILAQMENYRGIFICSTNLLENIDSAAMRRFQRKINFGYLKEEARQKLFKSYFLEESEELEVETLEELQYLEKLTAGDFKNIYQQIQFEEIHPSQADFVEMLKREMSFKKHINTKKIGF